MKKYLIMILSLIIITSAFTLFSQDAKAEYFVTGKAPLNEHQIGNKTVSVSISADGNIYAAVNDERVLYIFSTESSQETFKYETGASSAEVQLSKDGNYAALVAENTLKVFSVASKSIVLEKKFDDNIRDFPICDDGRLVLVVVNGTIRLYNIDIGISIKYQVEDIQFGYAEISGDGNYLVGIDQIASSDNVYFYSTSNKEYLWKSKHQWGFLDCCLSYDASNIMITQGYWTSGGIMGKEGYHGFACLYDKNGEKTYMEGVNAITGRSITKSGDYVVLSGKEPNKVWLFSNLSTTSLWSKNYAVYLDSALMSDSGDIIVIGCDNSYIEVFNRSGEMLWNRIFAESDEGWFSHNVKLFSNGKYIVVSTKTGDVLLFDMISAPEVDAGDTISTKEGEAVEFQATATDAKYSIKSYEWDFDGDGIYDIYTTNATAVYSYSKEGNYVARLKVTNDQNAASVDTLMVKVKKKDDDGAPGFEGVFLIFAILTLIVIMKRRDS